MIIYLLSICSLTSQIWLNSQQFPGQKAKFGEMRRSKLVFWPIIGSMHTWKEKLCANNNYDSGGASAVNFGLASITAKDYMCMRKSARSSNGKE